MRYSAILLLLVMLLLQPGVPYAEGRNVDLSTVPDRDTVQLTIYNSEDLTLVRETRKVSFKQGMNPLQFSWANTLIDPTSVELRFLTDPDKLVVLDTTFPHDKPQMLYWNVQSDLDGEATIEITYFTSGIHWAADYVAVADAEEETVHLEGFVRVTNNSGEEYEDAQVRLVVGKINLVEKIAQLAQVAPEEVERLAGEKRELLRRKSVAYFFDQAEAAGELAEMDCDGEDLKEKQVVKEGLSEYFIFSIEGTETIPNGWSKRMRSIEAAAVPLKIEYRYREAEYGNQLVRMYLMTNDDESQLGEAPLPDGVVRVFRDNGRDGLTYLAAQSIKYIPIGDKVELNLGFDPEVQFELVPKRTWRDAIWVKIHGSDVYREVGGPIRIDIRSTVAGWDAHTAFLQRIRNYSAKPIDVEVRRTFGGHVLFAGPQDAKLHDYRTVEYRTTVGAGARGDVPYEITRHEGRNKKQENVTIVSD